MVTRRKFIGACALAPLAAHAVIVPHNRRILQDLVAFWKLDEASGTRVSQFNGLDLSDNNTVGQRAGPTSVGNGADFVTNKFLSRDSETLLQVGDFNFSFSLWTIVENQVGVVEAIFGKDDGTNRDYYLYYDGTTDQLNFQLYNTAGVTGNFVGPSIDGNWNLISCGYIAATRTVWLATNADTEVTLTLPGTTPPNASAVQFRVGARAYDTFQQYLDGGICSLGKWHRYLTPNDRAYLYNAGVGRQWPF